MTRLDFVCEFESDIVLHSSSNTEGKIDRFHYIPGSNFLGMVAREYDTFKSDAFEVFHSGAVRFGDGHILHEGRKTFSVPYAWFAPKDVSLKDAKEGDRLLNEHFLTKEAYDNYVKNDVQLVQQREGFVTAEGKIVAITHNYRQKSAYNTAKRRSEDGAMFGYYALPKGTKWAFCVEMDNDKCKDKIKQILVNSKRLGKSKSAEYGRVKITCIETTAEDIKQDLKPIKIGDNYYIFLYAYSRLALTRNGINTYRFDVASLGIDDESVTIAWDKSHIRTSRYTPYVSKRRNFDPERLVIDKGSVIALCVKDDFDVKTYSQKIARGIGLYLSEGHGKVIVNPRFLTAQKPQFDQSQAISSADKSTQQPTDSSNEITRNTTNSISDWLKKEKDKEQKEYQLLKEVKGFIKNNNVKHKKSQWGQIRALCRQAKDSDDLYRLLFETDNNKGFLGHGKALQQWDERLISNLEKQKNKLGNDYKRFVKLLSIYAPKEDDKGGVNEQ